MYIYLVCLSFSFAAYCMDAQSEVDNIDENERLNFTYNRSNESRDLGNGVTETIITHEVTNIETNASYCEKFSFRSDSPNELPVLSAGYNISSNNLHMQKMLMIILILFKEKIVFDKFDDYKLLSASNSMNMARNNIEGI